MEFGAAIFFTDYAMGPVELGRALEERGFESLWAPEHSHIPLSRQSPFPQGGELPKKYWVPHARRPAYGDGGWTRPRDHPDHHLRCSRRP